jgi:DNA-binding XRE family transcriptional regulator
MTQSELAARAAVSRQLIAAAESGHNVPAVDAAIRIAQALGTTVEALFAPTPGTPRPALGEAIADGTPLRAGRVGDRIVAAPLADHGTTGAGWTAADGRAVCGGLELFPGGGLDGLVIAGCDPALPVIESLLAGRGAASLVCFSAPTGTALGALGAGNVHAAVVHGRPDELPDPPVSVARIHLAGWQVGLAHPRADSARSLEAILGSGMEIVQREAAAASQQALVRAAAGLGAVLPRGPRASGHIDAARRAAILGCPALTTEAAARAFGLEFLALERHTVEIWLDDAWRAHPAVEALGNLLTGEAFLARVAALGGYDLAGSGDYLAS